MSASDDDEDFGDDVGTSGDEALASDSDGGADEPQAGHTRRDASRKPGGGAAGGGTPFGAGGAKFAAAVAKLLGGPPDGDGAAAHPKAVAAAAPARGEPPAAAPILSRSRSAAKRVNDERAERLRLKAARRHKRELKEAGHVKPGPRGADPQADARERALRVTATRGVVTLFNAVAKAQKARREAEDGGHAASKAAATQLAPRSFLSELRRAAGVAQEEAAAPGRPPSTAGWTVLRDDYARGGPGATLKAWDRAGAREEAVIREHDDGDDDDMDDDV